MAIKYLLNTPNANNTIGSSEIASDAVTTAKIASDAITTAKINASAVTTAKIAANAVTTAKIDALAVTSAEIATDAVIAAKIADGAVTEGKIGALAVTEGKIASSAVTEGKIASDAVSANKIASSAVTTAKIDALAVTTAKINDLAVTTAKIAANAVTGAKLASDVDLPVGTLLNGTSLVSQIAAAAGGYDFKESAVTAVLVTNAQTVGGSSPYYNDSDTAYSSANLPDVPAYGFLIAETTLDLHTAIAENQNRALTNGDRVVFSVVSGEEPAASKRTGIYTVTRGLGKGTSVAAYFYTFTRASDANSTTNFNLGALIYLNAGDLIGRALFLSAGTFNNVSALFTLLAAGTSYTAGNGISISGGNAISVSADAAGPVTVSGSGVSVRAASASQSGVITSTQFKNLTRTVAASAESATATQTTNTTPDSFMLPVTAINTVVLVRAVVHSLSTVTLKNCVTEVRFALRRGGSGPSVLIGNTVTIFKEGDESGITAMTVEGTVGDAGADYITITGVNTFIINHNVVVTTQLIPNALSNA